ncbi:MAG: hypothetical protein JEZ05_03440 [Tenericutes bacterium]|nr:hypothetical protein [Mycoplasmatota bacterium]
MKIIDWLLNSDVSIQYQVHRDLLESDDSIVDSLQRRIETEGYGKRFLAEKHNDGLLGSRIYSPKWTSMHYLLYDLYYIGVPNDNVDYTNSARHLLESLWFNKGWVRKTRMQDVCITGMLIQMCCYSKIQNPKIFEIIDYLIDRQYQDGGWNCSWQLKHKHSSLHTTITVLEGLEQYLKSGYSYRKEEIIKAIPLGEEFILKKELFKSVRTKEVINEQFLRYPFPHRWHYEILRALDYFRRVDKAYDPRMESALQIILKKNSQGYIKAYSRFPGKIYFSMEEDKLGSKWNTLRVLRVLKKYKPDEYIKFLKGEQDD